jgi:hypothetical protein
MAILNRTDILEAVNFFFPNHYGAIIAGSQRNNEVFRKESDIDIVILDMLSSNVWSKTAKKEGYKIDFTIIPLSDVLNVMLDSSNDPKNGLLSMLSTGCVLSDPFELIASINATATVFFNQVNYRTFSGFHKYYTELLKLKKLIRPGLSEVEKTVIISDFISIITHLEVIKNDNWDSKTKHKLWSLQQSSPDFLDKLSITFRDAVNNDADVLLPLIERYQDDVSRGYRKDSKLKLLFDIGYDDFSISDFVNLRLPEILKDEKSRTAFRYLYLSPLKYSRTYHHNIVLVFDDNDNRDNIIDCMQEYCARNEAHQFRADYFYHSAVVSSLYDVEESVKKNVSAFIAKFIAEDNDFPEDKIQDLISGILFFLQQELRIPNSLFQKLNSLIAQKWILTKDEQEKGYHHKGLMKIIVSKMEQSEHFFKEKMPTLFQMILNTGSGEHKEPELSDFYTMLREDTAKVNEDDIAHLKVNHSIIKAISGSDSIQLLIYHQLSAAVLEVSCIRDQAKVDVLFGTAKALKEASIETFN